MNSKQYSATGKDYIRGLYNGIVTDMSANIALSIIKLCSL